MVVPKKALETVLRSIQETCEKPVGRVLIRPATPDEWALQWWEEGEREFQHENVAVSAGPDS